LGEEVKNTSGSMANLNSALRVLLELVPGYANGIITVALSDNFGE